MQNLFQNGVSEEDIVNMNDVVTKFSKDNTCNSFPFNNQDTNDTGKEGKDFNVNINANNNNNRTTVWKSYIDNLEKFKDIQSEIKQQIENRNIIKRELDNLNKQKQETTAYLQNSLFLL